MEVQTLTCLDDELGALVAGEQSHVHGAALHISAVFVHDGVELSVTHWRTEPSETRRHETSRI